MKNLIHFYYDNNASEGTIYLLSLLNMIYCKYDIYESSTIDTAHNNYRCDIAFFNTKNNDIINKIDASKKYVIGKDIQIEDGTVLYGENKMHSYMAFNDFVKYSLIKYNLLKNVVLVTGCNGGIGKDIVNNFKDNNWIVIGTDCVELEKSNVDLFIKGDLCNSSTHKEIIDTINKQFGVIDCIVNVAAVQKCGNIWEMKEKDWDQVYACNVKSPYLFVKYGLDLLKKRKGNIINIGSVHSINTSNKIAAYGSSKAAIVGLTRNMAIELGRFGIRANAISPGAIDTDMLRDGLRRGHVGDASLTDDQLIDNLGSKHLMGKVGQPNHISNMVLFLANNSKSEYTTGANFVIDGGATIKLSTE
jgi:NAD(P)-dependent dehydrogenase (short-subunit alcohol dehydrogenase family)